MLAGDISFGRQLINSVWKENDGETTEIMDLILLTTGFTLRVIRWVFLYQKDEQVPGH